tara:strand:+ start:55 stop:357 length:303 start_codon:yes stop_codon:yes gene_type:complete
MGAPSSPASLAINQIQEDLAWLEDNEEGFEIPWHKKIISQSGDYRDEGGEFIEIQLAGLPGKTAESLFSALSVATRQTGNDLDYEVANRAARADTVRVYL